MIEYLKIFFFSFKFFEENTAINYTVINIYNLDLMANKIFHIIYFLISSIILFNKILRIDSK